MDNEAYVKRKINMRNKVLRFMYTIESPIDDEVRFPSLCAVHLFDRLQMKNHIAIKFVAGIPCPDEGNGVICSFSQRQDVDFCYNERYGGMLFRFGHAIETNSTILPLLHLDSIGTQYIVLTKPSAAEFLTKDWNISEKALIQRDLAKFVCSINQDHDLEFFFSEKYYNIQELKAELMNWEQSFCQITGMTQMKRKDRNPFGTARFVDIVIY